MKETELALTEFVNSSKVLGDETAAAVAAAAQSWQEHRAKEIEAAKAVADEEKAAALASLEARLIRVHAIEMEDAIASLRRELSETNAAVIEIARKAAEDQRMAEVAEAHRSAEERLEAELAKARKKALSSKGTQSCLRLVSLRKKPL